MEYKPLVSIIMPVYNTEKYLDECITSILNQTMSDFELICVDDGSTDSSFTILNKYAEQDERIIVLQQKNLGGGVARNKGLEIARGKYLFFPDSDDFMEYNLLEESVNKAEYTIADIIIYKAKSYDDTNHVTRFMSWAWGHVDKINKEIFSYKDISENIFNSFQNWAWNKLFRHSFIKTNGITFQEIMRTNDLLFTCSALVKAERIVLLDKILYYYRIGMVNNCQATNSLFPYCFYEAFISLRSYLIEQKLYHYVEQSYIQHALGGCFYNLCSIKVISVRRSLYNFLKNEGFSNLGIVDFIEKNKKLELSRIDDFRKMQKCSFNEFFNNDKKVQINLKDNHSKDSYVLLSIGDFEIIISETADYNIIKNTIKSIMIDI